MMTLAKRAASRRRAEKMTRMLLGALALAGSTGFATCGGDGSEEGHAESATEATMEQMQEDVEEDTDR